MPSFFRPSDNEEVPNQLEKSAPHLIPPKYPFQLESDPAAELNFSGLLKIRQNGPYLLNALSMKN